MHCKDAHDGDGFAEDIHGGLREGEPGRMVFIKDAHAISHAKIPNIEYDSVHD